ncbi:hypothetical protein CKO28_00420 [Rhodovibrio sodomensis]|uniref:Uncharacterized protein n=1 Tax=Rhodovibrio sodomensis TaxID=1088 RepID=A0ABS1D7V7_9PROT|nr:hypothetical protein [Rhodovibrio sodomensis]MBK1666504.1 hypothetical protein [Rhodovibrio sodomensis]
MQTPVRPYPIGIVDGPGLLENEGAREAAADVRNLICASNASARATGATRPDQLAANLAHNLDGWAEDLYIAAESCERLARLGHLTALLADCGRVPGIVLASMLKEQLADRLPYLDRVVEHERVIAEEVRQAIQTVLNALARDRLEAGTPMDANERRAMTLVGGIVASKPAAWRRIARTITANGRPDLLPSVPRMDFWPAPLPDPAALGAFLNDDICLSAARPRVPEEAAIAFQAAARTLIDQGLSVPMKLRALTRESVRKDPHPDHDSPVRQAALDALEADLPETPAAA